MKKRYLILPEFFQRLIWAPLRLFMMIFCSLEIKGIGHIKNQKGALIFASNHQSELDPLLLVASLPFFSRHFPIIYVTRPKGMYSGSIKQKWKELLYGGAFFRLIGGFESHVGLKDYKRALPYHIDTLDLGRNVGIFPAGKIVNNSKEKVKAKGGVSFLAQQSKAPIVPVSIKGLENMTLKNTLSKKMKVSISFGSPISIKDIATYPHNMKVQGDKNDYEIAAMKLWDHIQNLN